MVFNILIVDDEEHVVNTMSFLLQERADADCRVFRALSGTDAIEIASSNKIHLLITDMRMPGLTGLELVEKITAMHPSCEAVILTGYSDFDSVYSAVQMNVAGYLLKTEEDDKIIATLNGVLRDLEKKQPEQEEEEDAPCDYVVSFIKKYIKQHLSDDLSVGALATAAGYNEDYLARIFKQSAGISLGRYVSEKRTKLVKTLLADDGISLDEVGRQAGFSSRSYFNRFVKMATGMSPRQYRIHLKEVDLTENHAAKE